MFTAADFEQDIGAWKLRHPFKIGQVVWPKAGSPYLAANPYKPREVVMRGESVRGLWIALAGIVYEFPIDQFTSVAPMPPVTDESEGAQ